MTTQFLSSDELAALLAIQTILEGCADFQSKERRVFAKLQEFGLANERTEVLVNSEGAQIVASSISRQFTVTAQTEITASGEFIFGHAPQSSDSDLHSAAK